VRLQREFLIANLLVRIHFIIVMTRWTGLAPWEFEFPFPGSLTSTFRMQVTTIRGRGLLNAIVVKPTKVLLSSSLLLSSPELSDTQKSMSLRYEPASEPLHICVQ